MTTFVYRGTSLTDAADAELDTGHIEGATFRVLKGRLDTEKPQAEQPRGTPVEDLPWYRPDMDVTPYLTEDAPVTGGVTDLLGTAIGFATGIPLVLYLERSGLSPAPTRVQYTYDWMDANPGALAWVHGGNMDGEIRTEDEGLMGLFHDSESGPVVWEWGHADLEQEARVYADEREMVAAAERIDISRACRAVVLVLEGRRTPDQALATFPGYNAGYSDDGENITRWPTGDVLATLHEEIRAEAGMSIDQLWTLNLTQNVMSKVPEIGRREFKWAYDGEVIRDNIADVPEFLFGG